MPDFMDCEPRPLSPAQLPLWRAEMLYRHTPRWTQMTVIHLHGSVDADRMERAIDAVVARHPALRMQLLLRRRQPWQVFTKPAKVRLHQHERFTPPASQPATVAEFLSEAADYSFPLYDAPLFRPDLLVLGPESFVLVLRLHHIAADGVALALIVSQIAACYRGETDTREPDPTYERWLDKQSQSASMPGVKTALDFYQRELAGAMTHHSALYDQPDDGRFHDPPHLPEATWIMDTETCEALRTLARVNRATLFIVLFAAYAATLGSVVGSSDLLIATFVSGRANQPEPLVASCINTLLVRLRLGTAVTASDLIAAVLTAWRPVRQLQAVPAGSLSDAASGSLPMPQFAINYLDMKDAEFNIPEVTAQVTHAQQGFPLNDLLLYALREQDGRLRLRLIVGSGTARLSEQRVVLILQELVRLLRDWAAPCMARADGSSTNQVKA